MQNLETTAPVPSSRINVKTFIRKLTTSPHLFKEQEQDGRPNEFAKRRRREHELLVKRGRYFANNPGYTQINSVPWWEGESEVFFMGRKLRRGLIQVTVRGENGLLRALNLKGVYLTPNRFLAKDTGVIYEKVFIVTPGGFAAEDWVAIDVKHLSDEGLGSILDEKAILGERLPCSLQNNEYELLMQISKYLTLVRNFLSSEENKLFPAITSRKNEKGEVIGRTLNLALLGANLEIVEELLTKLQAAYDLIRELSQVSTEKSHVTTMVRELATLIKVVKEWDNGDTLSDYYFCEWEWSLCREAFKSVVQEYIQIRECIEEQHVAHLAAKAASEEERQLTSAVSEFGQLSVGQLLGKKRGEVEQYLAQRKSAAPTEVAVSGLLGDLKVVETSDEGLEKAASLVKDYVNRLQKEGRSLGVVLTTDFLNSDVYPILSKYFGEGLSAIETEGKNTKEYFGREAYTKVLKQEWLERYGIAGENQYARRLVSLMTLQLILVTKIIVKTTSNLSLLREMAAYEKYLIGKLETGVRRQLKLGAIRFTNCIYAGVDNEYQNVDVGLNEVLSTQLAVSTKPVLTIPYWDQFDMRKYQTHTGEGYSSKWLSGENWKFETGTFFDSLIRDYRNIAYPGMDQAKSQLIKQLIDSGLSYFQDDYGYKFPFERGQIDQWFKQGAVSYEELMSTIINLGSAPLSRTINNFWQFVGQQQIADVHTEVKGDLADYQYDYDEVFGKYKAAKDDLNLGEVLEGEVPGLASERLPGKVSIGGVELPITYRRRLYLVGHYNAADFSLIKDIKQWLWDNERHEGQMDVLRKCFVSLGRGLRYGGYEVILRDTMLMSSAAACSLAAIGGGYGPELWKIDITQEDRNNMKKVLETKPEFFRTYAMRDSLVTLIHAMNQEEFMYRFHRVGVPTTQGSMTKGGIEQFWKDSEYEGYQPNMELMLGDSSKTLTPTGVELHNKLALALPYFIGSYKGGRNESFMYGLIIGVFTDYDMTGAYGTVMRMMGDPDYSGLRKLTTADIMEGLNVDETFLTNNYVGCYIKFECPEGLNYPPFAVRVDKTAIVYPRKGVCNCTGPELDVALRLGVKVEVIEGWMIPWRRELQEVSVGEEGVPGETETKLVDVSHPSTAGKGGETEKQLVDVSHPYKAVITWLQEMRLKYPKKSATERNFKDLVNNIYGLLAQGINNKVSFDARHNCMRPIRGGKHANPILASYVTGFIRAFLCELMNNVNKIGGRIISCTTDGFITDITNLEGKLLDETMFTSRETLLLRLFRASRKEVLGPKKAVFGLEIKSQVRDVWSWTTRGQFSKFIMDGHNSHAIAMTGYQRGVKPHAELLGIVGAAMDGDKVVHTVVRSLRGGKDIMTKGGHVTFDYREQDFSVYYDNRRMVKYVADSSVRKINLLNTVVNKQRVENELDITEAIANGLITKDSKGILSVEYSNGIWLETVPFEYAEEGLKARQISGLWKGHYNEKDRVEMLPGIRNVFDLAQRQFIHAGLEGHLQLVEGSPLLTSGFDGLIPTSEVDYGKEIIGKDSADVSAESILAENVTLPVSLIAKIANVKTQMESPALESAKAELSVTADKDINPTLLGVLYGKSTAVLSESSYAALRMQLRVNKHALKGGFVKNSVPKYPTAVSFANYLLQVWGIVIPRFFEVY